MYWQCKHEHVLVIVYVDSKHTTILHNCSYNITIVMLKFVYYIISTK